VHPETQADSQIRGVATPEVYLIDSHKHMFTTATADELLTDAHCCLG